MGEVVAGRFELIDVLGSGGVGTVWRAWDHRDKLYLAAKVLRHGDSDSLVRFVREAKHAIDHPHVVAPRNWVGIDDRVLFTMELVRGGSVVELLGDYAVLPEGWVVELTRQAAAGLQALHEAGYAHRDVKPGNLLLDATGSGSPRLRVSDFGTAAALDGPRFTLTPSVLGTPGYLSPEAQAGAHPSAAQDVYALGQVVRQMATGEAPGGTEPIPGSDGLAELVSAMCAPDPADRPGSMAEVVDALDRLPSAGDLGYGADPDNLVEVFDHVADLPAGWGPHGPLVVTRAPSGARPRPVEVPTAVLPLRAPAEAPPGASEDASRDASEGVLEEAEPTGPPTRSSAQTSAQTSAKTSAGSSPETSPEASPETSAASTWRRPETWLLAAGVVLLVLAFLLA